MRFKMDKRFFAFTVLGLLPCLLLIPGCADYKAKPLRRLGSSVSLNSNEHFVSFAHHVFSKSDCKKYLGRNVISKGYQPVQITFTNNSDRSFLVSPSNFSLPSVDPGEVSEKVHYSMINRVVGYGVGALFLWPLAVPAIVEGVNSPKANQQLDEDYDQKIVNSQELKPFSIVNGLIFVPKEDFDHNFTFTLVDQRENKRLHFSPKNTELKIS